MDSGSESFEFPNVAGTEKVALVLKPNGMSNVRKMGSATIK